MLRTALVFVFTLYARTAFGFDYQSAPPISILSIRDALVIFDIKIPPNVKEIALDMDNDKRAQIFCVLDEIETCNVRVGPPAFKSWALLGSTLAHEIEVHANQPHHLLKDLPDEANNIAEKQAYNYEVANRDRFHLTQSEVDGIDATSISLYPDAQYNTIINIWYDLLIKSRAR